jgi:DNA polymerase III epsilon subunit family exonuclease
VDESCVRSTEGAIFIDPTTDETHSIAGLSFIRRQWQAVTAPVGPVLVLAGPGSGKTRCLTGRIASLIQNHGADPSRICAITFTNKAAQEIAHRVRTGLGAIAEDLTLGTIHSLCLRMLRPHAKQLQLPPGFGVADEEHQRLILRRLGIHNRRCGDMLTRFGRRRVENYQLGADEEPIFQHYLAQLRAGHLIDFDDILVLTLELLNQDAEVLAEMQDRWDHILIDEFQDLDYTQYQIIKLLAWRHRSIFGVGDDDQSIFSWRGADPRLIAFFMRDFGIQTPIALDRNYRCSKTIFATARLILRQGELYPRREIIAENESAFPVEATSHVDETAEAQWLVEHLQADLLASGLNRGEYGILYRKHEIGAALEQALIAAGIPCQLGRGRALADDPTVEQVLCSLRLILAPNSELELECLARLVLEDATVDAIMTAPGGSLRDKLRSYARSRIGPEASKCWRFLYQVENLTSMASTAGDLANLVDGVLSLGVGAYSSPFDDIIDKLPDPGADPNANALADKLISAATAGGRVLLVPHEGLEIPLRSMIRKVLPNLRAEYCQADAPQLPDDLVLGLSASPTLPELAIDDLYRDGRSPALALFAALQIVESRQFRKIFSEYVVFDTETTDKDVDVCEVVELAAARVRDGKVVDRFHSLVRCAQPISGRATDIHGYKDADLVNERTFAEIWPDFRRFIGDAVLIAHNGQNFDVPILQRLTKPWDGLNGVSFFDSLPFARHLFPAGSISLQNLGARFGVETGRSHHALDDVLCLAAVFEKLQDERLRRGRVTCLGNLLDVLAVALAIEGPPALSEVHEILFRKGARRALGKFSPILENYAQEADAAEWPCTPVAEIIERLGGQKLLEQLRREKPPEDRFPEIYGRLRQIIALTKDLPLEESIRSFLDHLALSRSDGTGIDPDRVSLLTFHATKGLEFSRVYVIGVEDHQLPGYFEINENREADILEARRLLYVAMTRAKDRLCLTCCQQRNGRSTGGTLFLSEMGLVSELSALAVPAV